MYIWVRGKVKKLLTIGLLFFYYAGPHYGLFTQHSYNHR